MSVVLVTGGNRGIGLALVRKYLASGNRVIATCRDDRGAAAMAAEPGDLLVERLDVADPSSIHALAARLEGQPIDLLINNAGIFHRTEPLDIGAPEDWAATFATNVAGPVHITHALLPQLRAGRDRRVVAISSALGSIAETTGGSYSYRASKAALNMAMRSLAMDLAGEGFTIVVLSPGLVDTELARDVPRAKISPAESAAGLVSVIAALTPVDNGSFARHSGGQLAW